MTVCAGGRPALPALWEAEPMCFSIADRTLLASVPVIASTTCPPFCRTTSGTCVTSYRSLTSLTSSASRLRKDICGGVVEG